MKLLYIEVIAFLSGIVNIYLLTRCSLWNWFFGIITVSLYAIIFFRTKLYADMGLQGVFLIFQFYGLYQWCYGNRGKKPIAMQIMHYSKGLSLVLAAIVLFVSISFILKHNTDSTTIYADTTITTLSFISIGLYISKNLYLTSLLYSVFLLLCIKGYYRWRETLINSILPHSIAVKSG